MKTRVFTVATLVALIPGTAALALWQEDGIGVCTQTNHQIEVAAVPDGVGGAIIAWKDFRNGNLDIYAQRIDDSGNALWAENGVPVCTNTFEQTLPVMAPDGAGGAIILWSDFRNEATAAWDLYAQRIDGSGATQWTDDGVVVCNAAGNQEKYRLVVDEGGGAIVTWVDRRVDLFVNPDVYVGRLSPAGVALDGNGIAVLVDLATQNDPALCRYGGGGAFITWTDNRGASPDIYAARFTDGGQLLDPSPSIPICLVPLAQHTPVIVEHVATGGAILAWIDERPGAIYVQRINSSGGSRWQLHGVPAGTPSNWGFNP